MQYSPNAGRLRVSICNIPIIMEVGIFVWELENVMLV